MLELRNICMNYAYRVIYDHADFKAYDNELTVVMGKSGSGKSTLHSLITLKNTCDCEYLYNDEDIYKLSVNKRNEFIQKHFGIVNQVPSFINDLTIQQHIELCQSLMNGYDVSEYIHDLGLEDILTKYPMQLSGGEKMRAAVLFALIHQPDILVFDEPTSSLDRHHSEIIVEMMKKYAHQGHISIIFTHDSLMRDVADRLYYIEDMKLKMIVHDNKEEQLLKNALLKAPQKHYSYFLSKMYRHKAFFKTATLLMTSLTIAIASFSIFHGNSTIQYYEDKMNNTQRTGTIFKESVGNFVEPAEISQLELEKIKEVKGLDKIWPFFATNHDESILDDEIMQREFRIYQDGELIYDLKSEKYQHRFGTYFVDYDYQGDYEYDDKIIKTFDNKGGIYLNAIMLYNLLYPDVMIYDEQVYEELDALINTLDENTEIEFPLPVPIYINHTNQNDFSMVIKSYVMVKSKIKGIYLNDYAAESLAFSNLGSSVSLFYPVDQMLELIEKNKRTDEQLKEDEEDFKRYKEYLTHYEPSYYQFTIKDGYSFNEIKQDIEAMGYRVESAYSDAQRSLDIIKQLNDGLQMIATVISVITLFILFGIKYNQKEEYKDYMQFYTDRGYSHGYARKKLLVKFCYNACLCVVISFLVFNAIITFANQYYYEALTSINLFFVMFVLIMSISIEVLLPLLVTIGGKKEMIHLSHIDIMFKKWLLKDASIQIPMHSVTLIKGLSGTGKTTLLYRIGLVCKDRHYEYKWNETDIHTLSKSKENQIRRDYIGYVFQDFCLFEDFTVYENLEYYSRVANKEMNEKIADELLKSVELQHVITQQTKTLSNGEKQRLAIACALTKDPVLLVLDEPTSALDEDNERNIFSILQSLAHDLKKTIVVASHSYIADDYADCIYTIEDQQIVSQKYVETKEEVMIKKDKKRRSFVPYYLNQYFKKHFFMNILMIFILLCGCFCSIYIQSLIQETMNDVDRKINQLSDHQMVFFDGESSQMYMFESKDITQEQLEYAVNLKGVRSIYPLYNLKVEIDEKEYSVYPLFKENQLEGKLYEEFNKDRQIYLSYLVSHNHLDTIENKQLNHFIFNGDQVVEESMDISGVLSIGKLSEYNGGLNYVMMDYDDIVSLAKKYNIKSPKNCYALFADSIEDFHTIRQQLYEKYEYNFIENFQDAAELSNMKSSTIATMIAEKTFVKVLTLLLFLYLGYWNMRSREREFVLLHINGINDLELIMIMLFDLVIKLFSAFLFTLLGSQILSSMNKLVMNYQEILSYFTSMSLIVFIGICIMSLLFIKRLNPEKTLRN